MNVVTFIIFLFCFVVLFFLFRYFTKMFAYLADSSGITNSRWFIKWQMRREYRRYKRSL